MKKSRIGIFTLFILFLIFTGCSAPIAQSSDDSQSLSQPELQNSAQQDNSNASELDPSNPITLTLWHYYTSESQQALEQAVSDFNQTKGLETGIIVEAVARGKLSELEEAVTFSAKGVINSDPMPDIFSCYADKAIELNNLGVIADLNQYFDADEKAEYVQSFISDGEFDGNLLILPIVKSTELLYINKTALNLFLSSADGTQYSTDDLDDWESLYEISKNYYEWTDSKTPGVAWDGKAFMGYDDLANYIIISNKQLGIDIINGQDSDIILNKNSLNKIFTLYYSGISLGYFNSVGKFRSDDLKAGDLASYVGSSSSAAYFPTWVEENGKQNDIELLACLYPTFVGGKPYAIQQGAGMAVSKSSPLKEKAACIFLKWFTESAQNVKFAMTTGYLPVKNNAYTSAEFETALKDLQEGDIAKQNVGQVYEIALHQIRDADTYAAKPFNGSYEARNLLKNSLIDMGKVGAELAGPLKEEGFTAEEILSQLNIDSKFEEWLTVLTDQLTDMGIKFVIQ